VAVDRFEISAPSGKSEVGVVQHTYEHGSEIPKGGATITDGLIEMMIDYENAYYPKGRFMAHCPRVVECFVALWLDLKLRTGEVVARPAVFLKVTKPTPIEGVYGSDNILFERVKTLLDNHIEWTKKHEMIPKLAVNKTDLARLSEAVQELRQAKLKGA
jgi:hypothetical protein